MSNKYEAINKDDFTACGFVKKTHGIHGFLTLQFEKGFDDVLFENDFMFLNVDGLLVPFYMNEYNVNSTISAYVKFDGVDCQERAKSLVGMNIMVRSELIDNNFHFEENASLLIGFALFNEKELVGKVVDIEDFSGNMVLYVECNNDNVMVPYNPDLVVKVKSRSKKIIMQLPEGLLD